MIHCKPSYDLINRRRRKKWSQVCVCGRRLTYPWRCASALYWGFYARLFLFAGELPSEVRRGSASSLFLLGFTADDGALEEEPIPAGWPLSEVPPDHSYLSPILAFIRAPDPHQLHALFHTERRANSESNKFTSVSVQQITQTTSDHTPGHAHQQWHLLLAPGAGSENKKVLEITTFSKRDIQPFLVDPGW